MTTFEEYVSNTVVIDPFLMGYWRDPYLVIMPSEAWYEDGEGPEAPKSKQRKRGADGVDYHWRKYTLGNEVLCPGYPHLLTDNDKSLGFQIKMIELPAHKVNSLKREDGKPLFPPMIEAKIRAYDEDDMEDTLLTLRQARQLLKSYEPDYVMRPSSSAAQEGRIVWVPTLREPQCIGMHPDSRTRCPADARFPWKGRPEALCANHKVIFNRMYHEKRVSNS